MFDTVICCDCLEHVNNLEAVISEISRILKPGGIFGYDTVNRNLLSRVTVIWIMDPVLRFQYRSLKVTERSYSVHEWNKFIKPEELLNLLSMYNIAGKEMKGFGFNGFGKGGIKIKITGKQIIAYIGYAVKINSFS